MKKVVPQISLFDRIRQASNCKLSMTDVMQVYGPNKITVGDFWTLIPPSEQTVREEKKIKESLPDYTPGWLTSTVCSINSCKFYILYRNLWRFCNFNAIHSFVRSFVRSFLPSFIRRSSHFCHDRWRNYKITFLAQIIDAYLWSIQMENQSFFAADTTVFQIVAMQGSTRRLWKGENFKDVDVLVVPMNITTRHWTLLVCCWFPNEGRYWAGKLQTDINLPVVSYTWWG